MKIFFVDNNFHSLINFREEVIESFYLRGDDVSILYPESTYKQELNACLSRGIRRFVYECNPTGQNIFADLKLLKYLYRLYKKEHPDIIFQYTVKPNIYGSIAAFLTGNKCISMVAGLGYLFSKKGLGGILGRYLYKIGLRLSTRVIVLNHDNYKLLLDKRFVRKDNLILFPSGEGVNISKFSYSRKTYESVHFIMVARILYDKGYSEYVEAAKIVKRKYPNVICYLVGGIDESAPGGVPESKVKIDSSLNDSITYVGWRNDIRSILQDPNTIVVLPSKYKEGLNRSLMEACATGCPIITTDIPGCREMVRSGVNGFLVRVGDAFGLAEVMMHFIELPQEVKSTMSKNSRKIAEEYFDVKNVVQQYVKLASEITTPHVGSH